MKRNKFILICLISVLFISCNNQQNQLLGFWQNDKRIIEFNNEYFIIYNKTSDDTIAFRGTYSFAKNPAYAIKMLYLDSMNSEGQWESLKDTELENYVDTVLFKVDGDMLTLKIMGNNQMYIYNKTENPMEKK